jgi:hypothetical protein
VPVKRRIAKRRISPEAELKAWRMFFKSGYDYFDDLKDLGYRSEAEMLAAAPQVWARLGRAFLAQWDVEERAMRGDPWALEEFGTPLCSNRS